MSLFTELKRRNVFRVTVAYLVAGWLLVEATTVLMEIYGAPAWVPKMLVGVIALGFPVAVFFSWAFEITPEGIKREAEVDRSASVTQETAKRLDVITIILLIAAIALMGYQEFTGGGQRAVGSEPAEQRARSIAVLPFTNMSADADNEYFSDGISEEILNVLAKVPDLKVAARTSSFQFKGEEKDIPLIAQQLGVATVLEGSVRKQGDRVRITAQLINATDGFHLWSETYDRQLDDIFAIQDEIASSIARELQVRLDVAGDHVDFGTENLEAYDLYLKGIHLWYLRNGTALRQAIASFERAIEIDPEFARAYVGLASVWTVIADYSTMDREVAKRLARDNAVHGLALDPESSQAFAVLANSYFGLADQSGLADALYERALALDRENVSAIMWYALAHLHDGDMEGATVLLERATHVDPAYRVAWANLATARLAVGDSAAAMEIIRRLQESDPSYHEIPALRLDAAVVLGDRDEMIRAVRESAEIKATPEARALAEKIAGALEGTVPVEEVVPLLLDVSPNERYDESSPVTMYAMNHASILGVLGHNAEAMIIMERLMQDPVSGGVLFASYGEQYVMFRCEPVYRKAMRDLGYGDKVDTWKCEG